MHHANLGSPRIYGGLLRQYRDGDRLNFNYDPIMSGMMDYASVAGKIDVLVPSDVFRFTRLREILRLAIFLMEARLIRGSLTG